MMNEKPRSVVMLLRVDGKERGVVGKQKLATDCVSTRQR